jgi:hypothetical protein
MQAAKRGIFLLHALQECCDAVMIRDEELDPVAVKDVERFEP